MNEYFDLKGDYKGFKTFDLTKENFKKNIGKRILYVDSVAPYRGYFSVKGGEICAVRYSIIYFDDYGKQADFRNIKAAVIRE